MVPIVLYHSTEIIDMTNPTHCDKCGTKIEKPEGSCGTGYARVSPKGQDGPYEYHQSLSHEGLTSFN